MKSDRNIPSGTAGVCTNVVPFLRFAAGGNKVKLAVPDGAVTIIAIQESVPRRGVLPSVVTGKVYTVVVPEGVEIGDKQQSTCFIRNVILEGRADTGRYDSRCAKPNASEAVVTISTGTLTSARRGFRKPPRRRQSETCSIALAWSCWKSRDEVYNLCTSHAPAEAMGHGRYPDCVRR